MYYTETEYDKLYVDIPTRSDKTFQIYVGARGTGKTFSALRGQLNNKFLGEKFIYLRNTEREAKIAVSEFGNAFKSLNRTFQTNITGSYVSDLSYGEYYDNTDPNDETLIGYAFGLSTFAGARSIDLTDVDTIIFEEFIPELHIRKMRNRGEAFLNFYETVARNRETVGLPPVKCILLANAINMRDEILSALGVVHHIEGMLRQGERRRTIHDRDVYVELIDNETILKQKKNTALYRMAGDKFRDSALQANFKDARLYLIKPTFNQREYKLLLSYGDISVYFKDSDGSLHLARTGEVSPRIALKETEKNALRRIIRGPYVTRVERDMVTFDSFDTRRDFEAALNYDDSK